MKKNNTARIFGRVSVIVCSLLLLAALTVGASAHSFRDVNEYDEAIDLLSSIEVIKGYSNTSFGPNDNVTRWQMALLISKLRTGRVETSIWEGTSASTKFPDVKPASHYPEAINYAHNNNIIIGRVNAQTGETEFAPDENITVQDGITMAVRALGYPRNSYDSGYPNSYISKGKELGLFEGLYNLSYTAKLTRGQTAQMLYNALFAPTYNGATLADDAFGFVDSNIVLAATENMRFDSNVKYASSGKYTFAIINDYGRLGDSFELDASMFDFDNANEALGTMYAIRATGDYETILSLDLVSKVLADSKTASLTVGSASSITMGGISYKPVSAGRSYALETGKTPSNKEILVYALNDDVISNQYTSGKLLSASNMQGTTGYYTMRAFDDNGDGYADRAFYKAYSFGQYKADSSGRLAIASNNTASQIKVVDKSGKTTTVADGSYVLFSFDSQTKTLEIYKVLTAIEGTIGTYTASTSTITVNNVSYYLGRSDVRGAAPTTVAKDIAALSSVSNRKISGYADADTKTIFVCTVQAEEVSLSGNYYANDIGMVTGINYISAYDTQIGGYTSGTPTYYPVVYLNGNNDSPYIVGTMDGAAVTTANIQQLVQIGDIVRFAQTGTKTLYTGISSGTGLPSNNAYVYVLALTDVSKKATYTTSGANNTLWVDSNGKLYLNNNTNSSQTLDTTFNVQLSESTKIYWFNGASVNIIDKDKTNDTDGGFLSDDWKFENGSETFNGKNLGTNAYYSFYISSSSSLSYYSTVSAIYIRPFDFSTYASSSSSYNGIVYIPTQSVNMPSSTIMGNTYAYVYTSVFDLKNGGTTTAMLLSTKGRIASAGYYKVLNGYITDTTPITTSTNNESVSLMISPSIKISAGYNNESFLIQIGTQTYYPSASQLKIYQKTGSAITNSETMAVVPNESFQTYLNILISNPSMVKAVYMETSTVPGFYNGPFYIII